MAIFVSAPAINYRRYRQRDLTDFYNSWEIIIAPMLRKRQLMTQYSFGSWGATAWPWEAKTNLRACPGQESLPQICRRVSSRWVAFALRSGLG
jgi:hypothetical protein